jgi:N-acylneuraminate cytidylyltransferase
LPELTAFLQCTAPLTTPQDIDGTITSLVGASADTALAVTRSHSFLWRLTSEGDASGINHDKSSRLRRQDLPPQFIETGSVYVMRTNGFRQHRHRFFGKTVLHELPHERCWEIDEPNDLLIADFLLRARIDSDLASLLPDRLDALALDFDGVFTDNRVLVSDAGREAVWCSRADGWGLSELKRAGWPMVVVSTETNAVVRARCQKLGIDCLSSVDDKIAALSKWLEERDISLENTLFLGNEVNDLPAMRAVGVSVAVADAHPRVRAQARLVLSRDGGRGALRELADLLQTRYLRANASNTQL